MEILKYQQFENLGKNFNSWFESTESYGNFSTLNEFRDYLITLQKKLAKKSLKETDNFKKEATKAEVEAISSILMAINNDTEYDNMIDEIWQSFKDFWTCTVKKNPKEADASTPQKYGNIIFLEAHIKALNAMKTMQPERF